MKASSLKVRGQRDPMYLVALRALIHGGAAAMLLFGLALWPGLLSGILGSMLGVVAASMMTGARARTTTVVGLVLGCALGAGLGHWALTGLELFPSMLGVSASLAVADLVGFGLIMFALSLGLRSMASRVQALALVEVAAITGVMVYLVAGHRDMVISEPRLLSDWAWARGGDPILVLMTLGALTMATVPALLLVRQRAMKAALSLSALVFLGLMVFLVMRVDPPDPPPPRGALGLEGKAKKGGHPQQGQQGGQQSEGGKGEQSPDEMPFKDDYPRGEPSPVAVVLLHTDYRAPGGFYYFRQTAFSQYNGFRLVRSLRRGIDKDVAERFPAEAMTLEGVKVTPAFSQEVETTVAMVTDHKQPFGMVHASTFEAVENPDPAYFRRAYRVTSLAPTVPYNDMVGLHAGDPEWSEEDLLHYTLFPDDDRYQKLADEIVGKLKPEFQSDPVAQAVAIRRWIEKNSTYTRKTNHAGAKDPTASFLFGSLRGYCVHLAHAQAFLMRARGIPARVSAGYLADEARRGKGSSILLQNQDAHAWAEFYLDGPGWVVMDVSPEQVDDEDMPQVNRDLQKQLAELARGDKSAGKKVEPTEDKPWGKIAGLVLGPMGLLLLVGMWLLKMWRRFIWRVGAARHLPRTCYRALLDMLAEAGQVREFGETREAFARRLADEVPALESMTREHLRHTLGGDSGEPQAEAWREMYQQARREVSGAFPRWRRWLGLVNPLSWLRVH